MTVAQGFEELLFQRDSRMHQAVPTRTLDPRISEVEGSVDGPDLGRGEFWTPEFCGSFRLVQRSSLTSATFFRGTPSVRTH